MGAGSTVVTAAALALTLEVAYRDGWFGSPQGEHKARRTVAMVVQRNLNWWKGRVVPTLAVENETSATLNQIVYEEEEEEGPCGPASYGFGSGDPLCPPPAPSEDGKAVGGGIDVVPPAPHDQVVGQPDEYPDPVGRKTRFRAWAVRELRLSHPDLWHRDCPEHRQIIRKAIVSLLEARRVRRSARIMHVECIRALYFVVTPDYLEAEAIVASAAAESNASKAARVGKYVQQHGLIPGLLRALIGESPLSATWVPNAREGR